MYEVSWPGVTSPPRFLTRRVCAITSTPEHVLGGKAFDDVAWREPVSRECADSITNLQSRLAVIMST